LWKEVGKYETPLEIVNNNYELACGIELDILRKRIDSVIGICATLRGIPKTVGDEHVTTKVGIKSSVR
jgi:hypothetical protein